MAVVNGEMGIKAALETAARELSPVQAGNTHHILWANFARKNVFVRTVTHHYTGELAAISDGFIQLQHAAWIADDGRFNEALRDGILKEVEPYPGSCFVAAGAIVDICHWKHELPRSVK
jgi:hypothetical protein